MNALTQTVRDQLRAKVIQLLQRQGFVLRANGLIEPVTPNHDKEHIRRIHAEAVRYRVERARAGLERHENRLLSFIASGKDLVPERIKPRIVLVMPGSEEAMLFRYVSLHWSVPVSAGYGRRMRFVVYDESNNKLIGVIGITDPVFSIKPLDNWIGWNSEQKKKRLQNVMNIFVLGAVPPYSYLLCGKLVSLLATSNEVRDAFSRKYENRQSVIRREALDARLALLTTMSALGRSSIYNRITYKQQHVFKSVGFTSGSGEFHFSNDFYNCIKKVAMANCKPKLRHENWGSGFRNRRETIQQALSLIGLSSKLIYHGVKREIFAVPLASNTVEFLRCEHDQLDWYDRRVDDLFAYFRERWLLPRAARDQTYRTFDSESYRLWRNSLLLPF
jgi:predicted DNA-binding transcriptional regulator AlpA